MRYGHIMVLSTSEALENPINEKITLMAISIMVMGDSEKFMLCLLSKLVNRVDKVNKVDRVNRLTG